MTTVGTSLSNIAISFDNQKLKVNDIAYQIVGDKDNMPQLMQVRVMEILSAAMIIIFNPVTNKPSSPIPSSNVHTSPSGLVQQWIDTMQYNLQQIPKTIIHLNSMMQEPEKYMIKLPEMGEASDIIEI